MLNLSPIDRPLPRLSFLPTLAILCHPAVLPLPGAYLHMPYVAQVGTRMSTFASKTAHVSPSTSSHPMNPGPMSPSELTVTMTELGLSQSFGQNELKIIGTMVAPQVGQLMTGSPWSW